MFRINLLAAPLVRIGAGSWRATKPYRVVRKSTPPCKREPQKKPITSKPSKKSTNKPHMKTEKEKKEPEVFFWFP